MRTFPIFAFLFLVVPIIEIYLLIQVGTVIGALPTILLVVATAVIGAYLLRQQGLSTLARFQKNMSTGVVPAREMIEGVLLLIGGALLMTPGFFTDAMGFMCLVPFTRRFLVDQLISRSVIKASGMGGASGFRASVVTEEDIIEGEYSQKPDKHIGNK
ncbi:FxsA family protein [Leucothrix pacifica]|uniref:Exlusion protein FxsA n=1 Tax=Leucothrix pacifica TaxID=1247513 RepID=A0A317CNP7_9GAMM|nr:FxsA family protein [Leucothrix pacifica]PWQ99103.1 exlusion protein FxsA [Leucothrix pacifica]